MIILEKNGLLLCSIGFLIFLFSGGNDLQLVNVFSMITGVFLVIVGVVMIRKSKPNKEGHLK